METYIIIPEGLSVDKAENYFISDYYLAALNMVLKLSGPGDKVWLAPGNYFNANQPEDIFGFDWLEANQCKGTIGVVDQRPGKENYLDTLDNALYLKKHLEKAGQWPLQKVIIVCNQPHKWRSYLMFRFSGYAIKKVITTRPLVKTGRRMVKRLWFYDVLPLQYFYESACIFYNSLRFLMKPNIKLWCI